MNNMNNTKKQWVIAKIVLCSYILLCYILFASDWKAFKKSPARTSETIEQARPPLTLKWQFTSQGAFISSPIVYKGKVYIGSDAGDIFAFDAYTGEMKWQQSLNGKVRATPAAYNGTIYVPCEDGYLYAFDAENGNEKWRYYTGGKNLSSPTIVNVGENSIRLYFASGFPCKSVHCINTITGQEIWKTQLDMFIYSSPAVNNGIVYIGADNGKFYALDAITGEIKWSFQTEGSIYFSTVAVANGIIYAIPGNDDRKVYAFNPDGTQKSGWHVNHFGTQPTVVSSPAIANDTIYFASGTTPVILYAISASTGEKKWECNIGDYSKIGFLSSPAIANDVVL
jgi:outer membrane protein assembly factor BamB